MELQELKDLLQKSGIVGAGGAGFPTYAKLDERAETILLNCAECEPLLKLHRQLLKEHAYEIMKTFSMVADTVLEEMEKCYMGEQTAEETAKVICQKVDTYLAE